MTKSRTRVEQRLAAVIAKLEAGWPVDPWGCREYLSLPADPDAWEVIRAVHDIIQSWQRQGIGCTLTNVRAALVAGGVLLRGMKVT